MEKYTKNQKNKRRIVQNESTKLTRLFHEYEKEAGLIVPSKMTNSSNRKAL